MALLGRIGLREKGKPAAPPPPTPPPGVTINALSHALRDISNGKVLQVAGLIDALDDRGDADRLLQPLRGRLALLRPIRRMTRTRLLFTPFNEVLVPPAAWRVEDFALPRSVIRIVETLLALPLPDGRPGWSAGDWAALVSEAGACSANEATLSDVAWPLWEDAASRLAVARLPAEWDTPDWQAETGLTVTALRQMLPALSLVLQHARLVRSLAAGEDAQQTELAALLSEASRRGPLPWGLTLSLLLETPAATRVGSAVSELTRGSRFARVLNAAFDTATQDVLERIAAKLDPANVPDVLDAELVALRVGLVARLEALRDLPQRPVDEQRILSRLRQQLAVANRDIFKRTIEARLMTPEPPPPGAEAEAIRTLEAEARQLRCFAAVARRIDESPSYDRLLEDAANRHSGPAAPGFLLPADRLRLIELLLGSERARQAMERG